MAVAKSTPPRLPVTWSATLFNEADWSAGNSWEASSAPVPSRSSWVDVEVEGFKANERKGRGGASSSSPKNNGDVGRLVELPPARLGIRLPYSSPLFLAGIFSAGGGAPIPKLPFGTGTPPFFSNFAILSKTLGGPPPPPPAPLLRVGAATVEETAEMDAGMVDTGGGAPVLLFRCWRAAIRSLRLMTGGCDLRDVQFFFSSTPSAHSSTKKKEMHTFSER